VAAGNQFAVFGGNAFASVNAGLAAVAPGGTVIVSAGSYNEGVVVSEQVTLSLQQGAISFTSLADTVNTATLNLNGITLSVGSDNSSTSFSSSIAGTGSLTKVGSGTFTLAGSDSYTGASTVNGGELDVTGSITSSTTVNKGATLGGTGTISGTVSGAGTVSPGVGSTGVGILTVNGAFTPSGSVAFDVNAPYASAGTDYDQVVVNTGPVDLSHATLSFRGGTAAASPNQQLILIENNTTAHTLAGSKPVDGAFMMLGAGVFELKYNGGDGNDVVLLATLPGGSVTAVQIGNGNPQRSMVTSLTLTFALPITAAELPLLLGQMKLTQLGSGQSINLSASLANYAGTQVKLTFSGPGIVGGSLPDGRFSLSYGGKVVLGPDKLFRLFGDSNGDGKIDSTDQTAFLLALKSGGSINYPYFDYDGNGVINTVDVNAFTLHLGKKLAADGSVVPI
jgi:autotransporter-associated beta strand protein